ncbi:MAG: hypothetical protein K9N23_08185 [Akkermansiaceae bacterium]|nr:hypothetical protein [Akkermansiaceae bacterium]
MKINRILMCIAVTTALTVVGKAGGGNGYMGGTGATEAAGPGSGGGGGGGGGEEGGEEGGARPGSVDGPLNDKGSDQGALYGDLYAILRYQGGETKRVPKVYANGDPEFVQLSWTCPDGEHEFDVWQQKWDEKEAIGGEPILTEDFVAYKVEDEENPGEYVPNPQSDNQCEWYCAPTPSQCVQPVADYKRWGDLSSVENAATHPELASVEFNTIPLVMTYDPTWDRTEATVGTVEEPTYFVQPGGTWTDPKNGEVTYPDGVLWTDLIKEVSFGRLNQARAPESVLQSSFDEAIRSINDALAIWVDASGRLLLTKFTYSEYEVYTEAKTETFTLWTGEVVSVEVQSGDPLILGTVDKAIDSPLENMAIYLKLMRDGHLVTPGDQRDTIDRSEQGGIPIDLMLGLEDGPSTALRPTIDIQKMRDSNLGHLVDVNDVTYYTYYEVVMEGEAIVDYVLRTTTEQPSGTDGVDFQTWNGVPTTDDLQYAAWQPEGADFETCATALSAAADKGGKLTVDHVVYLNSILGINKVVGTSEDGSIDYAKTPLYFNYGGAPAYVREEVINSRVYESDAGDPLPLAVWILAPPLGDGGDPSGVWEEAAATIMDCVVFRELGVNEQRIPNGLTATQNIAGFTQGADDDLSIIDFVHTYQVPGNR